MPRRITKKGKFPNTSKATGDYSSIEIYLDEFGNHYGLVSANSMIKKGFPIAKYRWIGPKGYVLEEEWNT